MNIKDIRRKNLESLIQEKYKNQAGFVRETGINQGELSAILRGAKSFGEKKARKLEQDAGLPAGWLDQDHRIGSPVIAVDGNNPPSNTVRIRHVRLTVEAGVDGFEISQIDTEDEKEPEFISEAELIRNGWRADSLINITVRGDSMEPGICAGDIVKVNTADTEPRDGRVYVLNFEGAVVLKRLFMQNGAWFMRSDNPDKNEFPDRPLPAEELTQIRGRVVWFDNIL